jgi:predicted RNase H-like HicB family nuclease
VKYAVVIEQGEDGGWGAHAPDLPGLIVAAETREDVLTMLPSAIAEHLDALRQTGQPIPEPRTRVEMIEPAA